MMDSFFLNLVNMSITAFWLVVAAIACSVAVAIGFLTNPKEEDFADLPDITAHAYEVEAVVYIAMETRNSDTLTFTMQTHLNGWTFLDRRGFLRIRIFSRTPLTAVDIL